MTESIKSSWPPGNLLRPPKGPPVPWLRTTQDEIVTVLMLGIEY